MHTLTNLIFADDLLLFESQILVVHINHFKEEHARSSLQLSAPQSAHPKQLLTSSRTRNRLSIISPRNMKTIVTICVESYHIP